MHLPGMHFREVLEDGSLGPMRDTVLTFAGRSHEVAFTADNPGKWLLHCHMLAHAAAGMSSWIDVT
jgi:FtsP/CotA-like multicopper oxidase with cupredoxin domain